MVKSSKSVFIGILICLTVGFLAVVYLAKTKDSPFITKKQKREWSIGIYFGDSPLKLGPSPNIGNPILTAKHVTDIPAEGVADPFMIKDDSTWYMFFEIMSTGDENIGLATSSDGSNWKYRGIVLDEPFHLSYPYVFEWQSEYYMIPESHWTNSVRLYKAVDFPEKWSFVTTLMSRGDFVDPSIFQYNEKWWMFAETNPSGNDTLRLYYTESLMEPWVEHPKSPIVKGDANIARPGGRVLIFGDKIFRYTQDDHPRYGNQVWAFEITELTTTSYNERQISKLPVLKASGSDWNADGMHHIDPHQISKNTWIACVDGYRYHWKLEFGNE